MFSIRRAVTGLALAGAIAIPAAAFAQQTSDQPNAQSGQHERRGGFMHRFDSLNLSDQQKAQLQQIFQNFHQAHPQGSPRDPQAMQQLRSQIDAILTPDQRAKLQAMRSQGQNGQQRLDERASQRGGFFQDELTKLDLTPQQRQQIDQLRANYEKAHPAGSPRDPQARKQLRDQMMNVLTPQQRSQFQTDMQNWRSQHPRPDATATP